MRYRRPLSIGAKLLYACTPQQLEAILEARASVNAKLNLLTLQQLSYSYERGHADTGGAKLAKLNL